MEYKYYIRPSGDEEHVAVPDSLKTFARTRAAARGLSVVDETWQPRAVPPAADRRAPKIPSGVPHKKKNKQRPAISLKKLEGYSSLVVAAATALSLAVAAMQYFHPSTTTVIVQQKAQPPPTYAAAAPNGNSTAEASNGTSDVSNASRDFAPGAYAPATAPTASATRRMRRARTYNREQITQFQVGRAERALARFGTSLVMRPTAEGGWTLSDAAMISVSNIAKRNPLVELQVTPVVPCERRKTFFEHISPFGDGPGECSEDRKAALEQDGQRFAREIRVVLEMEGVMNTIVIEPTRVTPISPHTNRLDAPPSLTITAVPPPAAIERYVVQQAIFHATSSEAEGGADGI